MGLANVQWITTRRLAMFPSSSAPSGGSTNGPPARFPSLPIRGTDGISMEFPLETAASRPVLRKLSLDIIGENYRKLRNMIENYRKQFSQLNRF